MIQLGMKCKDKVTGFCGVVTGIVDYLTGCSQALLVPTIDEAGKLRAGEWFDVQRLDSTGDELIVLNNAATPGCDIQAPKR